MKREIAEKYFKDGYNCAQAVALAFKEEMGLSEEFIAKTTSCFGGGMGRMREVCGAVSGMLFVYGNLKGCFDPADGDKKIEVYTVTQELMLKFKEKNGTYICRELLELPCQNEAPIPEKRTEAYYLRRPCALLVGDAAEMLEDFLKR